MVFMIKTLIKAKHIFFLQILYNKQTETVFLLKLTVYLSNF